MRILSLEIDGFRSLRSVTWRPGPLNLIIGPNGSGKSNLLRVLELLSAAGRGQLGAHIKREGGLDPLRWDGQHDTLRFRSKMSPLYENKSPSADCLTYELVLGQLGATSMYRIESELLGNFHRVEQGQSDQPFKFLERNPRHAVVFDPSERGLTAQTDLISEEETLLSAAAGPLSANPIITDFQRHFANWRIYEDIHTDRGSEMRRSTVTRNESYVDSDGQNLIAVLHSLYTSDREFKNEVNNAMRAAFSDDFDELIFPPAADQRVQMRLRWKSLRRELSAADLSDGTLRFLFLLAVLANPKPPPLIAIDEPEVGLHPSMLPIVAEYAREAANRTQVILTTHSPEFLDAFGTDVPDVTISEWRAGETVLRGLEGGELAHWLKQYTLGELYRSNELVVGP